MKLLVLGANGLLGHAVFYFCLEHSAIDAFGTVRSPQSVALFHQEVRDKIMVDVDVLNQDKLRAVFSECKPDVVINCTGLTKHRKEGQEHLLAVAMNSLLPHQLADLCQNFKARLIHFSTDCVFSGNKGLYKESDFADADDVYGRSKWLGETDYPHAVTLRTSMIGPELNTQYGLLEWFLAQQGHCCGFTKAIFSGLPTLELARIVRDYVIPNESLSGLYHVSAEPIDKYKLLKIIADIYDKQIEISPDEELVIDRSLNGQRFRDATGYCAPDWTQLIKEMHHQHMKRDL